MAGKFSPARITRGLPLWGTLTALLLLGTITTLADLSGLSARESLRANQSDQRAIIDPDTGEVAGLGKTEASKEPAFDVGDKPAEEEAHPTPPAATEEVSGSETLPTGLPELRTKPLETDLPDATRSQDSLVSAPAPEITEHAGGDLLPKRGENNTTPASLYAHHFNRKPDQLLLSIVITDAGLDPQSLPLIMGMPKEVSIAMSPYTRRSTATIETLRNIGFEVWSMLPMMGTNYPQDDPGPLGLIATMPKEEIARRFRQVLAATLGSVGVVLPPSETVSPRPDAFTPLLAETDARGLLMLTTNPTRSIDKLSTDKKLQPIIRRADLLLDPEPNEAQIKSKLAGLLEATKTKGEYIVVATARPQTLALLLQWFEATKLEAPLTLAPLSAIYQPKEAPVVEEKKEEKSEGGHGGGAEKKEEKKPEAAKAEAHH